MRKQNLIKNLGGIQEAARKLSISVQAVYRWPDPVTPQIMKNVTIRLRGNGHFDDATAIERNR